jgi:hypothetical protein
MKTILQSASGFIAGFLVCFLIFSQLSFDKLRKGETKSEGPVELSKENEPLPKWYAPRLPSAISFAGERVPLDQWDVRERLDREMLFNYYYQNNVLYILKLSNRYFPVIEERLKANGVPDDFKYLCIAESNLLANATSRSGAVGFWQFLAGTAPGYGLELNSEVDKRRDLIESTDAACRYLKQAYQRFGTWTAAAASYNCGQGGYQKQADRQKTKYYYDLWLPEETNRYIFRILAFKSLVENAGELGFEVDEEELYYPVKTRVVKVSRSIPDLSQFAIANGTNYKTLRLLNPWLRTNSLRIKPGTGYEIKLPLPSGRDQD